MEPLRWIENGVARGLEDGMSADELLDAYQRSVLAAGKEDAEEDDETVDVEAPKDFDHEKAAQEGAKATGWAEHARAAAGAHADIHLLRHAESTASSALRGIVEASAAQWSAQGKL